LAQYYPQYDYKPCRIEESLENHNKSKAIPTQNDTRIQRRPTENEVREIIRTIYADQPDGLKPNISQAEKQAREIINRAYSKAAGTCSQTKESIIRKILQEPEFANQRNKAGKRLNS
jgi:hypothetical protein